MADQFEATYADPQRNAAERSSKSQQVPKVPFSYRVVQEQL